jgi:hypothetical protein
MSETNTPSPNRRGVGRVRWPSVLKLGFSVVTVIALVLGLVNDTLGVKSTLFGADSSPSNSGPDLSTIAKNLSISNRLPHQSTMGLEQEPNGTISETMIRWNPIFIIMNSNAIPVTIDDVDVHFPDQMTENGDAVQLKKKDSELIIVYQDVRDLAEVKQISDEEDRSRAEFARSTPDPVVIPPGGEERVLEFGHLYSLEIAGQPVHFKGDNDPEFMSLLGQYLQLESGPGNSYLCGRATVPVTIRTSSGDISKEVPILLLPVGCELE